MFILSIAHYQHRYLADDTALKRERQQAEQAMKQEVLKRNLPPTELKLTLDAIGVIESPVGEDVRASLIRNLVYCSEGASPQRIGWKLTGRYATIALHPHQHRAIFQPQDLRCL